MEVINKIIEIILTKQVLGTAIVILAAYIISGLFNKLISKILITGKTTYEIKKRKTIVKLFQSSFKYLIFIIALLIILGFYGVDTKSLVASLGVVGVALGLALQDTLKDIISGVSLILENYLTVGDIVTFNDFTGEVIELGIRTTKIKKASGEVMIVANRNIDTIINSSQKKANLFIEIDTAYEEECKKVEKILRGVINEAIKEGLIIEDSDYLGINELGASSIKYLLNIHCDPTKKMTIKRIILERVKIAYEKANIKIPYNQIEVHHGQDI